jgi:ABC-type sulfate transport system permease component
MSQWGLLLDIVAVLTLGLETWVKTRGIQADSFTVGYGEVGGFWRVLFRFGYPLLLMGFVLQFIGASK